MLGAHSDEGDHLFRSDPDQRFGAMPITLGAKRRWRMNLDRSDRHPSTNAMRWSAGEVQVGRNSRRRRGGNVGIRRLLPDFQARREGWKTQGLSFPGFPPRVISTALVLDLGLYGAKRRGCGCHRRDGDFQTSRVQCGGRQCCAAVPGEEISRWPHFRGGGAFRPRNLKKMAFKRP